MSLLFPSLNVTGAPGHPGPKGDAGESISAPEVIVSPTSLTVTRNQTATFYCSVDGNPKPSVFWSKISGSGLVNTEGQGNKLQITSAVYNDSGSYVCTASNVLGHGKKVVKLFVEGKHTSYIFENAYYRKIHCLTSELHVKFHLKNRCRYRFFK